MTMERDSLVARLTRAGGAMANILYNLKQQTYGTERIRDQMDEAQLEWDAALRAFQEGAAAAALSRPEQVVKALEWSLVDDDWWGAETVVGCYEVRQARASVRIRFREGGMEPFDGTIDEAKAAAQADFEKRILSALHPAPEAASAGVAGKVKPLDLSILIRDAFLSGRGLKDGDKLSEADQAAFMEYDPTEYVSYKRIYVALYPSRTPSDTAPSPKGVSDGVRAREAMRHSKSLLTDLRIGQGIQNERFPDNKIEGALWDAIPSVVAELDAALAALSQEPVPATAEERAASKEGA